MQKKRLFALLPILLIVTMTIAPLVKASPITINIDPTTGIVGTTVAVSGVADTSGGKVDIYWDLPGNVLKTVTAVGTDYSTTIEVPESVAGTHAIGAKDVSSTETSAKDFVVEPSITLDPVEGCIGTYVKVSGTGFATSSSIEVVWDDPSQTVLTTSSNVNGSFTGSFPVPPSVAGTHNVDATDGDGNTASATFTVWGITMTRTPSYGCVGTLIDVSGGCATPEGTVTILWDESFIADVTALSDGTYSYSLSVPPCKAGTYTITALDVASTNNASETFEVYPIAITLVDPDTGPVGTLVHIEGTCTTPSGDVEIWWDDTKIDVVVAYGDGTYEDDFTVPPSVNGEHTITAKDVSATNNASATFTVIAKLTLTPTCGVVGDFVEVLGTGFSGEADVEVYFNNELVLQTTTNETGSFNGGFYVPWVAKAGVYEVIAIDEHLVTAYATFTVKFVMYTRSPEYFQGDYPSFFIQAVYCNGEPIYNCYIYIDIYDPKGYLQYSGVTWTIADGTVPYDMQFFSYAAGYLLLSPVHLPSDALVGTWTWKVTTCQELAFSGSFKVVERVDLRTLLGKLNELLEGQDNIVEWVVFYGNKLQLDIGELAELIMEVADYLHYDHLQLYDLIAGVAEQLSMEHGALADLIGEVYEELGLTHDDLAELMTFVYEDLEWKIDDLADFLVEVAGVLTDDHQQLADLIGDIVVKLDDTVIPLLQAINATLVDLEKKIDGYYLALNTTIGEIVFKVDPGVFLYLEAIEAKLDFVNATTIRIESAIGDIEVKLDDIGDFLVDIKAEIVALKGDVATIDTTLGIIQTDISNLNLKVTSIEGDIATISTTLGTIEGKITAIEGDIATIQTDIGEIQVDLPPLQETSSAIESTTTLGMSIGSVLSAIAAIAAVAACILIHRRLKVAS